MQTIDSGVVHSGVAGVAPVARNRGAYGPGSNEVDLGERGEQTQFHRQLVVGLRLAARGVVLILR